MKSALEIEKEVSKLETRRQELAGDLAQAQQSMEAARTGLIEGKASADAVIAAQSAMTAIKEAIEFLDGQITSQRGLLASAQAEEAEAKRKATVASLEKQRAAVITEFTRVRAETHARLLAGVREMLTAFEQFTSLGEQIKHYAPDAVVNFEIVGDESFVFGWDINNCVGKVLNQHIKLPKAQAA